MASLLAMRIGNKRRPSGYPSPVGSAGGANVGISTPHEKCKRLAPTCPPFPLAIQVAQFAISPHPPTGVTSADHTCPSRTGVVVVIDAASVNHM